MNVSMKRLSQVVLLKKRKPKGANMRIKETKVYKYEELSDEAKEKARDWFRQDYPDYDWWGSTYDDIAERAKELGIELKQKPVKLMSGKTRYDPEIYFSGFYHQGSGSSFAGTWDPRNMKLDQLKAECLTETELHHIGDTLAELAKEDPGLYATISAKDDNWISVEVTDGEDMSEKLDELEYKSPEYNALAETCRKREEELTETLRDFNRWIYKSLKSEYEYLVSDESVEESIRSNEYEFTENGSIA